MADATKEAERLPYRLKEPFITTTELALFRALTEIMGGRYLICPKVALNDIFYIVRPNENVHFFNKFFRKHVDFLLCEPKNLLPVFGVNLVRAASKTDTRESDKFMDELFTSAGIPLVHVAANEKYDAAEIMNLFQLALMKIGGTGALRVQRNSDSVPQCPTCGKMMVLRIQRDGPRSGKKYYGCMDSPKCDGMIAID
ncbi:MAG: DUF2726 domain-containing protein [Anaerolineales bacterium]|nr:DUF2726 domain-containing protein [Anaerolineales bacterium]